jgi:hypothetical protein
MSNDPKSKRTALVRAMFTNCMFDPHVSTIDCPDELPDADRDSFMIRAILDYSANEDDNDFIVIKDNSVSSCTPDGIADIVKAIVDPKNEERAHITYLSMRNENCALLTKKRFIANKTTIIARAVSPEGFQAMLITKTGRELLRSNLPMLDGTRFDKKIAITTSLTQSVASKSIDADIIFPSLFTFDVANSNMSERDISKIFPCRTAKPRQLIPSDSEDDADDKADEQKDSYVTPAIVVFIIFIILLFLYIFTQY